MKFKLFLIDKTKYSDERICKVIQIMMTHLNYPLDLYRRKLFDVWDFFSDEMLKCLFERKYRYCWLIMQDDQQDSCNYLCGRGTMIQN